MEPSIRNKESSRHLYYKRSDDRVRYSHPLDIRERIYRSDHIRPGRIVMGARSSFFQNFPESFSNICYPESNNKNRRQVIPPLTENSETELRHSTKRRRVDFNTEISDDSHLEDGEIDGSHKPRIKSDDPINIDAWTIDSVSLLSTSIQQLEKSGLLDDSVLEFFFRFAHQYILSPPKRDSAYFFNSYFYSKLSNGGLTPQDRHNAVSRWTNRLVTPSTISTSPSHIPHYYRRYIWEFDLVVIPLNHTGSHWTLALVCFPFLALRKRQDSHVPNIKQIVTDRSQKPTAVPNVSPRKIPSYDLPVTDSKPNSKAFGKNLLFSKSIFDATTKKDRSRKTVRDVLTVVSSDDDDDEVIRLQKVVTLTGESYEDIRYNPFLHRQNFNDLIPDGINQPAIFHLDSLPDTAGPPENLKNYIVEYFQQEFISRCPHEHNLGYSICDVDDWYYVPFCPVPQQENGFDCGIFLIEYIRHLFMNNHRIKGLLYECPILDFDSTTTETPESAGVASDSRRRRRSVREKANSPRKDVGAWIEEHWFNQEHITHRRVCLKQMLIYMQLNVEWQLNQVNVSIEDLEGPFKPNSSMNSIDYLRGLFSCCSFGEGFRLLTGLEVNGKMLSDEEHNNDITQDEMKKCKKPSIDRNESLEEIPRGIINPENETVKRRIHSNKERVSIFERIDESERHQDKKEYCSRKVFHRREKRPTEDRRKVEKKYRKGKNNSEKKIEFKRKGLLSFTDELMEEN